jgi:hypothetical protein
VRRIPDVSIRLGRIRMSVTITQLSTERVFTTVMTHECLIEALSS